MSRRSRGVSGSPLLIGAITTLVVIVGVFLAYNANKGLPFVPTYDINATLPDASSLQIGNDVRVGGTRVGIVASETPRQDPRTGAVEAIVGLKLDKRLQSLPLDTSVVVRDRSDLGEKYLQLTPGKSSRKVPPGGTLPLSDARPTPVEIDQVLNMFNGPTRVAEQTNLTGYGDAFAGRGANLNNAISQFAPALAHLAPEARTLAARSTDLGGLFRALERAAGAVAPVARQQGQLFVDLDTTFRALAGVTPSIAASIQRGPGALDQAIRSLPYERPYIEQLATFMHRLAPSAAALRAAAPSFGPAIAAGARNLGPARALNDQLTQTLKSLQAFAQDPRVPQGLGDLTQTTVAALPLVSNLAPMQTVCNYPTLFFRNLASTVAEGDGIGTWLRGLPVFPYVLFGASPGSVIAAPNSQVKPASAPENGDAATGIDPKVNIYSHLHSTPYPYVAAPGQPQKCEAGNETYVNGQTVIGHSPTISNGRDYARSDG